MIHWSDLLTVTLESKHDIEPKELLPLILGVHKVLKSEATCLDVTKATKLPYPPIEDYRSLSPAAHEKILAETNIATRRLVVQVELLLSLWEIWLWSLECRAFSIIITFLYSIASSCFANSGCSSRISWILDCFDCIVSLVWYNLRYKELCKWPTDQGSWGFKLRRCNCDTTH